MTRLLPLLALVLLSAACGDDAPMGAPADAAATDAASADLGTDAMAPDAGAPATAVYFRGIYFVPEREAVSTYPVAEAQWTVIGDEAVLAYNLPRMLVGQSERVDMRGPFTPGAPRAELTGPLGTATCELDAAGLPTSCLEHFVGIEVDLDRVRREAEDQDPANVEARVSVAERFGGDPIGVIEPTAVVYGPEPTRECAGDADCARARCDLEGLVGLCEPPSEDRALGTACDLDFQCASGSCSDEDRVCETD